MTDHNSGYSGGALDVLTATPAGRFYEVAPKQVFLRGFEYYRSGAVQSLAWDAGRGVLTAVVAGTRRYEVRIGASGAGLVLRCTCPAWSVATNCKHVVCALLTAKNLIDPIAFHTARAVTEGRERLRAQLLGTPEPPAEPAQHPDADSPQALSRHRPPARECSIVIDTRTHDVFIVSARRRLSPYELLTGPEDLQPLGDLHRAWGGKAKGTVLADYLAAHGNERPVLLRGLGKERQVRYDSAESCAELTALDARAAGVRVFQAFRVGDRVLKDGCLLDTFALDAEQGTIHPITDRAGGETFRQLASAAKGAHASAGPQSLEREFTLSPETARGLGLRRRTGRENDPRTLLLLVDGEPAAPVHAAPAYRLTVLPAARPDERVLEVAVLLGDRPLTTHPGLFIPLDLPPHLVSPPLRTIKRRAALCAAMLDLYAARSQKEVEEIIDKAARHEGMERWGMRGEVAALLRGQRALFNAAEETVALQGTTWLAHTHDKGREALLYRIPHAIFGDGLFRDMPAHDQMRVGAPELAANLPRLHGDLAAAGIALHVGAKPVQAATWEFSVEAAHASEIDWFELRPEIRCDGRVLGPRQMQRLLRDGVLEDEDAVRIVGPAAGQVFAALVALGNDGSPGRGGKKRGEVVRVPRLAILDWLALRRSGVAVRLPPEDEEVLGRILRFERVADRPLPPVEARLRPYQSEGYQWLAFLYEHRFGACLADDMGLGKTLQAICLLAAIKTGTVRSSAGGAARLPHLIVVPPSLLFNWESELRRFCPGLAVVAYTGAERTTDFDGADVVLTSYGLLRRDIARLEAVAFDVAVFDEAQAVKNVLADTTGAARRVRARFVLAMTGTPLENHLGEYLSILDLALPGLIDDGGDGPPTKRAAAQLAGPALERVLARTRPFVLRRTKDEILSELPPKVETDIHLELSEAQKALYHRTVARVRSEVEEAYRTRTEAKARIIALTALLRLRQICVAPQLVDPAQKETSPKIGLLIEQLHELIAEGHRALVFSQFTSFLDLLEPHLERAGIGFVRLDGSTPVAERRSIVGAFQDEGGPPAFLLSLKAGGQGLNLTRASYVFHLDPWWNPAVENQASDRAHRIGQHRTVTITRVLMRHTVEEKMMELKRRKLALYRAVLEGKEAGRRGAAISREDFAFLLG